MLVTIKENHFGLPKHTNKNIIKIEHLLNMGQNEIDASSKIAKKELLNRCGIEKIRNMTYGNQKDLALAKGAKKAQGSKKDAASQEGHKGMSLEACNIQY